MSGSRILFGTDRDGDWEIASMNPDGTRLTSLTWNWAYDWSAAWSPNGAQIVFSSNYLDGERSVRSIDKDGRRFMEDIEVVGDQELFLMKPDGSDMSPLTDNSTAFDGGPDWSPDGSRIAFHSDLAGEGTFDIYSIKPDGTGLKRLTNLGGVSWDPSWSPDGNQLVFASQEAGSTQWGLYLVSSDGSGLRPLDGIGSGWKPSWSPLSDQIVFASRRAGSWDIYLTDSQGSDVELLTESGSNNIDPIWSPSGSKIAFGSDRSGPPTVFVLDIEERDLSSTGQTGIPTDWAAIP